jgi:molybdenum cofactor cytidylyltransferase
MICAVVLAAGRSSRMGVPKQLLPWRKTTVIGHVVDQLLDQLLRGRLDEIYVIVGHEADGVAAELEDRPVHVVTNPDYAAGMLSSVRYGLRALPASCEAIMIVLGDQPAITTGLIATLTGSFRTSGKGILVPVHGGRRGHPLLLSARYRQEILTCYDDVGLRGLLQAHPDDVFELHVSTAAVLSDLDDLEDYRREAARWAEQSDAQP